MYTAAETDQMRKSIDAALNLGADGLVIGALNEMGDVNRPLTRELVVTRVGEQIVGPSEAARFVGRDLADAFSISGPVVLVQASLPNTAFEHDGQRFEFSSGMYGKAETVVRNEPIAYAFAPSLKQWPGRARAWSVGFWHEWTQRVHHVE